MGRRKNDSSILSGKSNNEAVEKSKYLSFLDKMPQGFCIIEVLFNDKDEAIDYRFLEVNSIFEQQTGLHNATGKTMQELQPAHEAHWFRMYGEVVKTGNPIHFEREAAHLAGGVWYEVFAYPFGEPSEHKVAIFFNDVTERKLAGESLRQSDQRKTFMLQLSDAINPLSEVAEIEECVTRITMDYFNADRCYYCEIKNGQAIICKDARKKELHSVCGEYPLVSMPIFNSVIETGHAFMVEDAHTSKLLDEHLRELCKNFGIISFINVPVIKNGTARGLLCLTQETARQWTQTDVELVIEVAERIWNAVERAQVEAALRDREQQLEKALKLRDEFVSIASHELKTPITSMKMYTEIVHEKLIRTGDEQGAGLLAKLNGQLDRLVLLINTLLDTTKIAEGQLKLELKPTDIGQLLHDRVDEIRLAGDHEYVLNVPLLPLVSADRERIGQVIANLLSNAIKYSPPKSFIIVTAENKHDYIKVIIRDQGPGIPEKDQQKIFDRFYRVTKHNMNTYPGAGLGLFISAEIVKRHGGIIGVESKEGGGAEFYFTIPLAKTGE